MTFPMILNFHKLSCLKSFIVSKVIVSRDTYHIVKGEYCNCTNIHCFISFNNITCVFPPLFFEKSLTNIYEFSQEKCFCFITGIYIPQLVKSEELFYSLHLLGK